ncbi:hypothetical protein HNO88_004343 [Novosphingobium chloroacetimidivorans]|uniref:Uncharacterized protein n=1 Tax=Novosphingobium chloroacetimidivorans TaxID=1428314 RepID=A0A7W7KDU7_9SPHN|nr:hypothetical protein [Novosphingobium chloroacetimidivorans]
MLSLAAGTMLTPPPSAKRQASEAVAMERARATTSSSARPGHRGDLCSDWMQRGGVRPLNGETLKTIWSRQSRKLQYVPNVIVQPL